MHSTNDFNTFIAVSPDSGAAEGRMPAKEGSIARLQFDLLRSRPYAMTSDDLLFEIHCRRNGIPESRREAARAAFFAKPLACLRASPLVKQIGWGLHHDEAGRIALYGVETERYRELTARPGLKVVAGMRGGRA